VGVAGPERIGSVVPRIMGRSLGPESVRIRPKVGFNDWLDDERDGPLRHSVSDRLDPQRTQPAVHFESHDAPYRLGSVGLLFQVTGQFPQKHVYPDSALYGSQADPINAGTASVSPNKTPRMGEYLSSAALVVERVTADRPVLAWPWHRASSVVS